MTETFTNTIELEIAALSKEIDAKRRELEAKSGIVREGEGDKELVRASLAEKIQSSLPATAPAVGATATAVKSTTGSYLDSLDPETTEKINELIQTVFKKGLEAAIRDAKHQDPYILDAFHDALVDKMYDELKRRKAIE